MSNIVVKKNAEREKVGSKELRLIVEREMMDLVTLSSRDSLNMVENQSEQFSTRVIIIVVNWRAQNAAWSQTLTTMPFCCCGLQLTLATKVEDRIRVPLVPPYAKHVRKDVTDCGQLGNDDNDYNLHIVPVYMMRLSAHRFNIRHVTYTMAWRIGCSSVKKKFKLFSFQPKQVFMCILFNTALRIGRHQ